MTDDIAAQLRWREIEMTEWVLIFEPSKKPGPQGRYGMFVFYRKNPFPERRKSDENK
jgi:hypothetical protein